MLATIGIADVEELFDDIPAEVRLATPCGPGRALPEQETLRLMRGHAARNRPAESAYLNFMGGGSYEHFIPAAVGAISQRGELLTAYTPYQAEASQGTLQIIYEFQSMICSLTGMGAANASMYDGASALAEAALMAVRVTGRNRVVLPATLHPHYRRVVETTTGHVGIKLATWSEHEANGGGTLATGGWSTEADEDLAAVVVQHPNVYGFCEDVSEIAKRAHEKGALVIAVVNPMSLSVLKPPGEWGADIAVGECQPIGLPMNFGGPYAGFMATRKKHIRKMPGRIVGRTKDEVGREAFVLTLQTREQHIRRERATSNICTNQGLCATMTTLYLALVGQSGFAKLGETNLANAGRLFEKLTAIPGVEPMCGAAYFNEFTLRLPVEAEALCDRLRAEGILGGVPATRIGIDRAELLIVCATETKTDDDIDRYVATFEKVLGEMR